MSRNKCSRYAFCLLAKKTLNRLHFPKGVTIFLFSFFIARRDDTEVCGRSVDLQSIISVSFLVLMGSESASTSVVRSWRLSIWIASK